MKIVLVLLAVIVGIWFFKSARRESLLSAQRRQKPTPTPDATALDMVRCRHCDLHLPKADAIAGKEGMYCSSDHKQLAES